MRFAAVLFLALTFPAVAEKPWPEKVAEAKFVTVASADLPKGLQDVLLKYDDYEMGTGKLPDSLDVFQIRLSKDGPMDYVVIVPQGFSGGPEFNIFEARSGKFAEIGGDQGLSYFGPRINGYYQIIAQGRGGAGAVLRTLFQFSDGRYRVTRMTDYKVADDKLHFVRERDANEFVPKSY